MLTVEKHIIRCHSLVVIVSCSDFSDRKNFQLHFPRFYVVPGINSRFNKNEKKKTRNLEILSPEGSIDTWRCRINLICYCFIFGYKHSLCVSPDCYPIVWLSRTSESRISVIPDICAIYWAQCRLWKQLEVRPRKVGLQHLEWYMIFQRIGLIIVSTWDSYFSLYRQSALDCFLIITWYHPLQILRISRSSTVSIIRSQQMVHIALETITRQLS